MSDTKLTPEQNFQKGVELAQIGTEQLQEEKINECIENTLNAIQYFTQSHTQLMVGKAFRQLAEAYQAQQNWVGCLASYQESINWDLKVGKLQGVVITQLHVFELLLQLAQLDKAQTCLTEAKNNLEQYRDEIPKYQEFADYITDREQKLAMLKSN